MKVLLVAVALVLLCAMGASATTWMADSFRQQHSSGNSVELRIYDFAGVCVYVTASYRATGVAVISKAALPANVGCQ